MKVTCPRNSLIKEMIEETTNTKTQSISNCEPHIRARGSLSRTEDNAQPEVHLRGQRTEQTKDTTIKETARIQNKAPLKDSAGPGGLGRRDTVWDVRQSTACASAVHAQVQGQGSLPAQGWPGGSSS